MDKRILAAAAQRLHTLKLLNCIDGEFPDSVPHDGQQQVIDDIREGKHKHYYIRASNQCWVEGTMIHTPSGPLPIQ